MSIKLLLYLENGVDAMDDYVVRYGNDIGHVDRSDYMSKGQAENFYNKIELNDARKYWFGKMDKIPVIWNYYSYKGNKTIKELFAQLDTDRLEYLETEQKFAENKVIEAQKEAEKKRKAVEKFKKQVEKIEQ